MDKLIHGPSADQESHPPSPATAGDGAFHPLSSTNILADIKILLTRPRYFFEFFADARRINHVVWAKVILIFLGLSALNSMVSFSQTDATSWSASVQGFDPRFQAILQESLYTLGALFNQVFVAAVPFFTLVSTAITAALCLLTLRLLGSRSETLSWSGIFCTLITAQWTTVFGFVPGAGSILIALLPLIYGLVGLSQVSRLSKLRAFLGAFVLPGLLVILVLGLLSFALASIFFGFFRA